MEKFNPCRFAIARQRSRIKGSELAKKCGLSAVTISRLAKGKCEPEKDTIKSIAKALNFPVEFFYMPEIEVLDTEEVSFRSLTRMSAIERNSAIAAGSLGMLLWEWIEERFGLPEPDVPDFRDTKPEEAAIFLRRHWRLGEKPIPNLIKLIESKGVRVLSLCENTKNVDAFSFYKHEKPYIFLNNFKTPEHSLFDTAHELGHLVLHRHAELSTSKQAEIEANQFAAAFLIPIGDLLASGPRRVNTQNIIKFKKRWRVSAMALSHRLHSIDKLSDWEYRSICIELSKLGYRTSEPEGTERHQSVVIQRVLEALWKEKITTHKIASDLNVPVVELDNLLFNLTQSKPRPNNNNGLYIVP